MLMNLIDLFKSQYIKCAFEYSFNANKYLILISIKIILFDNISIYRYLKSACTCMIAVERFIFLQFAKIFKFFLFNHKSQ